MVRAPKAAFKLRAKKAPLGSVTETPDFASPPSPENLPPKQEPPKKLIELESISEYKPSLDPVFETGQNSRRKTPTPAASSKSDTTEPVPVNGGTNSLNGDTTASGTMDQASSEQDSSSISLTDTQKDAVQSNPPPAAADGSAAVASGQIEVTQLAPPSALADNATNSTPTPTPAPAPGSAPAPTDNSADSSSAPLAPAPGSAPAPSTDNSVDSGKIETVLPAFQVNDNSRIDITACAHEFETSMARNDFSSQSTEASLSAGCAGFAVSVSAGYSNSSSNESKTDTDSYEKTLVAKYLFPRADIYIDPDDLEPTPELAALLKLIATKKNIKDLRRINSEFGHLFCQSVTVGGRLLSTKIMKTDSTTSEEDAKEQFKVSVGVSVTTPIGNGAGMNHSEEKGSSTSSSTKSENTNENNVFEAVGGDTILAANPVAWATTVGDYRNWRVINRDGMTPLSTMISGMPGYQQVREYFVQAVPALAKFIELDDGRQVLTRLRLTSLGHGLSFWNSPNPVSYYLAHTPRQTIATPRLMCLAGNTIATVWNNENDPYGARANPLFRPSSFHAPVIQGYENNIVNLADPSAKFGVDYDQTFMNAMWTIVSPFNESLQHEARVILKTVPFTPKNASIAAPSGSTAPVAPTPMTSSLVVFRNQQGVFLPAMSDIEEYQYWRILKTGASFAGENIKEGDEETFAWAFSDQLTGFRDYQDDVFGRRRNQPPAELESDILHMKLPWPRFESLTNGRRTPNSMVMSPDASTSPVPVKLKCLSVNDPTKEVHYRYLLEEVKFRIDTVSNGGLGDTGDYMLKGIRQDDGELSGASMVMRSAAQVELSMLIRMFFL